MAGRGLVGEGLGRVALERGEGWERVALGWVWERLDWAEVERLHRNKECCDVRHVCNIASEVTMTTPL